MARRAENVVPLGIGDALIRLGSHIGYWYRKPQDKYEVLIQYFKAGVDAGQLCLALLPGDELEPFVSVANGRLEGAIRDGKVRIAPAEEFYFKNNRFHPTRLLKSYPDIIKKANEDGFPSVRAAGEIPWRLMAQLSMPSFFEYEERASTAFFDHYPAVGLCLFDMERYGVEWTLGILRTHPKMLSAGGLFDNPSYRPS